MHAIHNARITLGANALNNLGLAAIGAGFLAPLAKGDLSTISTSVSIWIESDSNLKPNEQVVV
jgi:hypothetical protein